MIACSGVEIGQSVLRFGHRSAMVFCIAFCIRLTSAERASPRW
jgi:hypothetical protein